MTEAVLHLPISIEMLEAALDDDAPLEHALSNLAVPQVSCLVFMQYLPKLAERQSPRLERFLAEIIQIGHEAELKKGPGAFIAEILPILGREKIRAGYECFADLKILLMTAAEVVYPWYLTADGNWDYAFCRRRRAQSERGLQRVNILVADLLLLLHAASQCATAE